MENSTDTEHHDSVKKSGAAIWTVAESESTDATTVSSTSDASDHGGPPGHLPVQDPQDPQVFLHTIGTWVTDGGQPTERLTRVLYATEIDDLASEVGTTTTEQRETRHSSTDG
jgi:hypothetical protein